MSRATAAAMLPEPAVQPQRPSRSLKPVAAPAKRNRPKLAYALIALGGAAAIALGQVGLSLAITHDSYVLAGLNSEQRELDLQSHALQEDLAGLASPQLLATKASELGMVVAGSASYLRLSDSTVLGANVGAGATSTIDPTGAGAVHNALLAEEEAKAAAAEAEAAEAAAAEQATEEAVETADPALPPPITDGLPSPTTR